MSVFDKPFDEAEQAAEKATDHLFPQLLNLVGAVFAEIRKTRVTITIDLGDKQ